MRGGGGGGVGGGGGGRASMFADCKLELLSGLVGQFASDVIQMA